MQNSQKIKNIKIGEMISYKPPTFGDVWTTTWADDDDLYSIVDDGSGWDDDKMGYINVTKTFGEIPNNLKGCTYFVQDMEGNKISFDKPELIKSGWTGIDMDGNNWKGNGLTCLDGVLYLFLSNHRYGGNTATQRRQLARDTTIVKSLDHGKTWSLLPHNPIIENCDFEKGSLEGWVTVGDASITGKDIHYGSPATESYMGPSLYSVKLTGSGSSISQKITGLRKKTSYRLGVWVKVGNADNDDTALVGVVNSNGNEVWQPVNSNDYSEVSIILKTGDTPDEVFETVTIHLKIPRYCKSNAVVYGDNFILTSAMFPGRRFGAPFFIEFQKDGKIPDGNGGWKLPDFHNANEYVYAISNDGYWDNGNNMILGRVRRSQIGNLDNTEWQFFTGGDGMADENWLSYRDYTTIDKAALLPGLDNPVKMSMCSFQYIPGLQKYIAFQWHFADSYYGNRENSIFELYESDFPWGPWIKSGSHEFIYGGFYCPCIISKSISEDGCSMYFFTAGSGPDAESFKYYGLNVFPLTLE